MKNTLIAIVGFIALATLARQKFESAKGVSQAQQLLAEKAGKDLDKKKEKDNSLSSAPSKSGLSSNLFLEASNILVNNNTGATVTSHFTQSESSILAFGNNVVIAFNDAGSFAGAGSNKFTGYAYSSDSGATFTDGGTLPTNAIGDAGDPVLARNNATGRIYLATLGFNPTVVQVFRSDNNGVTWMPPVVGTPGGLSENKPWITVDNIDGPGNGNVYLITRRYSVGAGMYFYRSTDQGATFGPTGGTLLTAATTCEGGFVVVGTDHSVYAFWFEKAGASGVIKMRKSTDLGVTFGTAVTVAGGLVGGVNGDLFLTGIRQGIGAPAPFRTNEFPHAAINPVSGHIYVTYNNDGVGVDKADIFLVMSTDGGANWSVPLKVNNDFTITDQWQPTIAVTPNGLKLGIFYYSRQEDSLANNLFKYYSRIADISGGTLIFGPGAPVSAVASFPEFGRDAVVNSIYMGDYDQTAATDSSFFVTWADNRDDLPGGLGRKDPNVYFSRISTAGPTPAPLLVFGSADLSGGNGNGVIDLNECNSLSVNISNSGNANATGISATLASNTPGISISQGNSAYPDIVVASSAANSTAFTFCTGPGFVCGTPVQFTLTINHDEGTRIFNFNLPSGILSSPSLFENNTSTPIPDFTTTNIPITVSGFTGNIGKVVLSLHLTHTFDADLDIFLISPDNTIAELSTDNGGSGDNYGVSCLNRTLFDDEVENSIVTGAAPFAGSFRPEQVLAIFKGKSGTDVNGEWTLRIIDDLAQDAGNFYCATLSLSPVVCTGETTSPAVTINQAASQADPTSVSPISFTATFSENVTGFDASDISFTGSTAGGTLIANVTGGPAVYNISVSGMNSSGTVVASIPAGAAISASTQPSLASTSIDNTVTFVLLCPTWYADTDSDGYGDPAATTVACSQPEGYVSNDDDCDDEITTVHPGATETCNGIDDNCNGQVDEGVQQTFYADTDADGYGNPNSTTQACTAPPGYVNNNSDCNDANVLVHPGAIETCNSVDDDCDGQTDEGVQLTFYADTDGDGFGNANSTNLACSAPAGYVNNSTDCNDADDFIFPGAVESCNALDDDCDGQIDEGCSGVPIITINDITVYESQGQAVLTVSLSFATNVPVKIRYRTVDGTAVTTGRYKDYNKVGSASIILPPGAISASIPIGIIMDNIAEPIEYFDVEITKASNATVGDNLGRVTILDGTPAVKANKPTPQKEIIDESFTVITYPNPSRNNLRLTVNSNDQKNSISMTVVDIYGRVIESRNIKANSEIRIGDKYRPGSYFVRVLQGINHKEVKFIKIPD